MGVVVAEDGGEVVVVGRLGVEAGMLRWLDGCSGGGWLAVCPVLVPSVGGRPVPGCVCMEGPVGSSVQARVGLAMAWTPVSLYDAAGGVSSYSYLWAEYILGVFAANGHEDNGEEVGQE